MATYVNPLDLHRVVPTCIIYRFVQDSSHPEYLVLKRRPDEEPFSGRWEVAGGGLERKEYEFSPKATVDGWVDVVEKALRKEVTEETALVVGEFVYGGSFATIRAHDGIAVIGLRFSASYVSGEVKVSSEATEARWVTAKNLDPYNLIGSIADDIRRLDKKICRD